MRDEPPVLRWYRRILRLYPAPLRRRHGDEMAEVVRRRWERVRGGSRLRRLGFTVRTWGDALVQAAAAWIERAARALRGRGRGSAPGPSGAGARARAPDAGGSAGARLGELPSELLRSARSLARSPGFTATAVLTLALGIGANTAIFSIVEAVLLEPLPLPESGRLVTVTEADRRWTWTPAEIVLDLRASDPGLAAYAGLYPREVTLTGGEGAVQVPAAEATPNLFRVLGLEISRGRDFTAADARPGAAPSAILGPGLRERRFGGPVDVVGRSVRIDGTLHRIVGVLERDAPRLTPRSGEPEIWIPTRLEPAGPDGDARWIQPVLRLAEGRTLAQGQSALDAVMRRFQERHAELEGWHRADRRLAPLKSTLVGDARSALLALQVAVGVLLLLACVNVANLLLVRTAARHRELAVRSAMGASRGRLLALLLSESVLLALAGGAAALALLVGGLDLLTALAPADVPRLDGVSVDAPVLLFTLAVSVATGVIFGVVPAAVTLRGEPAGALRGGGRSATASRRKSRMSQGMVVAQVTLTLVLLVAAGAMARSFASLTARDPGFRARGVLAVPLHVSPDRYDTVPELEAFYRDVRARVAAVPGVAAAAVGNYMPIRQGTASRTIEVEGRPEAGAPSVQYGVVSPDYFTALGIPLLRGRAFTEDDGRDRPRVAVVNQALARRLWPEGDALGRRIRFQDGEAWWTVVGVVGDVRGDGLARDPAPGFYVSYRQRPADPVELTVGRSAVVFVRARSDAAGLAAPLRRAVREVEPRQPVREVVSLERIVSGTVAAERFRAVLLALFAGVALLLVVAGVYGVVAQLVAERTREFGIRVAVGATRGDIAGRVLRWGLRLTAVGLALGVAGVAAMDRHLSGLLFQVRATDPAVVAGAASVVAAVTLLACLLPARRALAVDPVDALRPERPGGGGASAP